VSARYSVPFFASPTPVGPITSAQGVIAPRDPVGDHLLVDHLGRLTGARLRTRIRSTIEFLTMWTRGGAAVECVAYEQSGGGALRGGGHVPWPGDLRAGDRADRLAGVVEDDRAPELRGRRLAVGGWRASDDHMAAGQDAERGREPDAAKASPR
jgi:hypothetical protein